MTTSHDYPYSNKTAYGIENDAIRYAWAGYFLFVLISSLVGDSTILIASLKYRAFNLHKVMVVIIQHRAFCDLMVTTTNVIPLFVSLISNEWVIGKLLCCLTVYLGYYFNTVSLLLICNMTTSKLLILKYPFRMRKMSVKNTHMICRAFWLAALIIPVTAFLVATLDGQDIIYFSYRIYRCDFHFRSDIWNWLWPFLSVTFLFIPNCMVIATTIYLLIIAKKVAGRGRESLKWQGIVTTVLTATVYCISILPYFVYTVGESIVTADNKSSNFFETTFHRIGSSFLYLNTISNFYVYSLSVYSFRDFIRSRMQQAYQIFTVFGTSASHGTKKIVFRSTLKKYFTISEDF